MVHILTVYRKTGKKCADFKRIATRAKVTSLAYLFAICTGIFLIEFHQ